MGAARAVETISPGGHLGFEGFDISMIWIKDACTLNAYCNSGDVVMAFAAAVPGLILAVLHKLLEFVVDQCHFSDYSLVLLKMEWCGRAT